MNTLNQELIYTSTQVVIKCSKSNLAFLEETPSVLERTALQAIHIRPHSGLNDNLEYEIYMNHQMSQAKMVIVYLDWEEISDDLAGPFDYRQWLYFFQNEDAAGVIWAETLDEDGEKYDSCDDYDPSKKENIS